MGTLVLDGRSIDLAAVRGVLDGSVTRIGLSSGARRAVERAARLVDRIVDEGRSVYGVSTGFGRLQHVAVPRERLGELQVNLLRSHAAGVGAPLPREVVRLAMALRANTLASGHSGITPSLLDLLLRLYDRGVTPVVPSQGSVGASGDLAPLAHMALVLIGEGTAEHRGVRLPGAAALRAARIRPARPGPKDALCLVNGTQVTNAIGLAALARADGLVRAADVACALTHEALRGSLRPLRPEVHALRPHPGQAVVASNMRRLLRGSAVPPSHRRPHGRLQDAYSLRCAPVVHGAARDALSHALAVALREANSVTDNPLLFPGGAVEVVSAGNFHAEPLALAFDYATMATAEIASISERRTESLVNPDLNGGLPPFLAAEGGLHSGYMIVQVTAAALVAENRVLSHPASVDSLPTSAGQEDHVSMGTHAARKLLDVVANAERVLACELLCAAEGMAHLDGLAPGRGTGAALARLRRDVPRRTGDASPAGDLETLAGMVRDGSLVAAAERAAGPLAGLGDGGPARARRRRAAAKGAR